MKKTINRIISIFRPSAVALIVMAAAVNTAGAAVISPAGVKVSSINCEKSESRLIVDAVIDVAALKDIRSDREVWITPVLKAVNSADSIAFSPVCVAGHNRYYLLMRQSGDRNLQNSLLRAKNTSSVPVHEVVEYQPWMEYATVTFAAQEKGCCEDPGPMTVIPGDTIDFIPRVFEAEWAFITPPAETKTFSLSGSAYIDFPVNRTELYPDYRRNPEELKAIIATIDKVRNDGDITIDSITITGYASPEGPYDNNVRLAAGRTKTLIEYVRDLYSFPQSKLRQASVPEDWAGLEARLLLTDIVNRDAILSIARDTTIAPDARDAKLKKSFPIQYRWMLENIYPALRHSDYTIDYTVVDYNDVAKIAEMITTAPQKLSLGEMFTLANTLDPNSDQYREVFEVAVRMYPDNKIANVNAANAALKFGDFTNAAKYLDKCGDMPEAIYLRGVYKALQKEYTAASALFEKVAGTMPQAAAALRQIKDKKLSDGK